MGTPFQEYLEDLESLSAEDLDRSVSGLLRTERESTARVIAHLAEISRRKLYREQGYSSLFAYATQHLGLSEGSAWLRVQVANVARRVPQVLAALAEGKLSLTVAGQIAGHLTEENADELILACSGMSKRAVEKYLVRFRPKEPYEPSIRKRPSPARPHAQESEAAAGTEAPGALAGDFVEGAAEAADLPPPAPAALAPGRIEPASVDTYNFRFAAKEAFKEKLDRFGQLLGFENARRHIAEVLERALELALDQKDPERRQARRRKRQERRDAAAARTRAPRAEMPAMETPAKVAPRPDEAPEGGAASSRHVPRAVRDRVMERAGYRCEFTAPDGRRCTARAGLEIEHEEPFAIFGRHDESRLRAFWWAHNQLRAVEVYGKGFIQRKVAMRLVETRGRSSQARGTEAGRDSTVGRASSSDRGVMGLDAFSSG